MAKSSWSHALVWVSLAGVLAGCSTVPENPKSANSLPLSTPDATVNSDEPIPKVESPSRSGNPDTYVVFGRRYQVKETSAGYREEGIASWYGWEFHGRKTSSGPLFNMFELTAAHKSLPIPTYVQVTNLENGRQIVVKVTDRGPFVGERAIDLSYAAADRLGMLEQGTARVEITALAPYQFLPKLAARRAALRELMASRQNRPEPEVKPAVIQFARATPARPSAQVPGQPPAQVLARVEREKAAKLLAQAQAKSARLALADVKPDKAVAGKTKDQPPMRLAQADVKSDKAVAGKTKNQPPMRLAQADVKPDKAASGKTKDQPPMRLALANTDRGLSKTASKTTGVKPAAKVEPDRNAVRPTLRLASASPPLKAKGTTEEQRALATNSQNGKSTPARQKVAERSDAAQSGKKNPPVSASASGRTEVRNVVSTSKPVAVRIASLRINRSRTVAD